MSIWRYFCPSFASKQNIMPYFLRRARPFSFDRIMVLFLYDYKDIPVRFLKAISFKKHNTKMDSWAACFSGFFMRSERPHTTNHQRSKLMLVSKKTVYVGADIVTMSDTRLPRPKVRASRMGASNVGTREGPRIRQSGRIRRRGFRRRDLYPGFIDTHSHMSPFSRCLNQVYCSFAWFHRRRAAGSARQGRRKR